MPRETYTVTLRRVLNDGVAVEPREAVAILDTLWAVTALTMDEHGRYQPIPSPDACLLTAFGDVEVEPRAREVAASLGPAEVATALCRAFIRLTQSGNASQTRWTPQMTAVVPLVRAQAAAGGRVAFGTPDALLAVCRESGPPDGSAALANLYARWEIASVSTPASTSGAVPAPTALPVAALTKAMPEPPVPPLVTAASAARPARVRVGDMRTRIRVAVAAAAMLTVLAAGAAGVRRMLQNGDQPASSTHGADASAPNGATARPEIDSGHAIVAPSLTDADAVRPGAHPSTTDEIADHVAPEPGVPASTQRAPHRMVRAADVGAAPYSPSFARPTGALLFHSGITHTGLHEASLGTDGSLAQVRTLVRDGASNYHVQLSPDGTQIAFDSDKDGERAVYVGRRDGSNVRRVSGVGLALVPSWSPDGTRLAFVRADHGRPRVWQLWSVDLRTNRLQQHTSHRVGQPWGGSWFPDGRHIAYSLEDRLVVLDMQSGARRVFASPVPGRLVRTPAVSPDGARVVFQVRQSGMWMLHVASGRTERVLSDRSAQEFAWSPDGRAVAYHTTRSGSWEIWAVGVN